MTREDSTVSWQRHAQALQILAALVLMAYSNSFGTGFSSDSRSVLLQDERIRSLTRQHLKDILFHNYAWPGFWSGLYRPVSTLSYLFNFAILGSGGSPTGYHWVNFTLHAANAFLVYLLILHLFRQYWPAVFAAAVWALHPVNTEAVTYIVGRPEELAALGVLAALVCYLHAAGESGGQRLAWLAGCMISATVAVFSKEGGIMVIALAALYDFAWRRHTALRDRAAGYLALGLPVLAMLVVRWAVLRQEGAMQIPFVDNPISGAGFFAGRLAAIGVIGKYLWLLLWPVNLSADYSYRQLSLVGWYQWISVAAVLGLLALAAICHRRSKTGFFLLGFSGLALLPVANLAVVTGTIMAERLLYLPSVGFAAAVALGTYRLAERFRLRPVAAVAALSAIGLAYGARTYQRNPDWRNNVTLFTQAAETSPESFKPHMVLATTFFDKDTDRLNLDQAIAEAEKAQAIVADLPDLRKPPAVPWVLGTLYYTRGDDSKALESDLQAVRIDRAQREEYRRQEIARGKRADELAPTGPPDLYAGLGRIYLRRADPQKALGAFLYERRLSPGRAEAYANIALADQALNKAGEAASAMLESYVLDGSDAALYKLLDLYRAADPKSCAAGSTLHRDCPIVRSDFCRAYLDLEQGFRDTKQPDQVERFRDAARRVPGCVTY